MVGASKILTVSYGTFSCTLEGFDEPFNTMKAIAEYFRDLAADDRYFGAEPPTPDAAMLHKIAEREIQRRVDTKIENNAVILRASDRIGVQPSPVLAEAAKPVGLEQPPTAQDVPKAAPRSMDRDDSVADPSQTKPIESDSVAAKLLRIRAAVAQAREGTVTPLTHDFAPVADLYLEDEPDDGAAFVATGPAPAQVPEPQAVAASEPQAEPAAEVAPEVVADLLPEDAPEADDLSLTPALEIPPPAELAPELLAPEVLADTLPESAPLPSTEDRSGELAALQAAIDAASDSKADNFEDEAEGYAGGDDEAIDHMLKSVASARTAEPADQDGVPDEAVVETPDLAEASPETTARAARARARVIKVRKLEPVRIAEPNVASVNVTETAPHRAGLADETEQDHADATPTPAVAAESPRTDEETADLEDFDLFSEDDTEIRVPAKAVVATELSAEAEADLLRELAEVERDADTIRRSEREGLAILEDEVPGGDAAVTRLMKQADTALQGPENRRRHATISHLKAAVAATEADRAAPKTVQDGPAPFDRYRDDLARVMRPRKSPGNGIPTRPAPIGERPAPLVLVSEQRIDRPLQRRPAAQSAPQSVAQTVAQAEITTIRPRRISAGNLAIQQEDAADESKPAAKSHSYAAFIDDQGVTSLLDQLEAAAVYVIHAERRPHFSRPQLMRMLETLDLGPDFSREDGLRAFGTLLRQGKIGKIKRGQFSVLETSRFVPEASKLGR